MSIWESSSKGLDIVTSQNVHITEAAWYQENEGIDVPELTWAIADKGQIQRRQALENNGVSAEFRVNGEFRDSFLYFLNDDDNDYAWCKANKLIREKHGFQLETVFASIPEHAQHNRNGEVKLTRQNGKTFRIEFNAVGYEMWNTVHSPEYTISVPYEDMDAFGEIPCIEPDEYSAEFIRGIAKRVIQTLAASAR